MGESANTLIIANRIISSLTHAKDSQTALPMYFVLSIDISPNLRTCRDGIAGNS